MDLSLSRKTRRGTLDALASDVLSLLADSSDRVVNRAALLDKAWSGLAVGEGALSVRILGLRKVLAKTRSGRVRSSADS